MKIKARLEYPNGFIELSGSQKEVENWSPYRHDSLVGRVAMLLGVPLVDLGPPAIGQGVVHAVHRKSHHKKK